MGRRRGIPRVSSVPEGGGRWNSTGRRTEKPCHGHPTAGCHFHGLLRWLMTRSRGLCPRRRRSWFKNPDHTEDWRFSCNELCRVHAEGAGGPSVSRFPAIVTVGCALAALLCDPAAGLELGGPGREGDGRLGRLELAPQAEARPGFTPCSLRLPRSAASVLPAGREASGLTAPNRRVCGHRSVLSPREEKPVPVDAVPSATSQ